MLSAITRPIRRGLADFGRSLKRFVAYVRYETSIGLKMELRRMVAMFAHQPNRRRLTFWEKVIRSMRAAGLGLVLAVRLVILSPVLLLQSLIFGPLLIIRGIRGWAAVGWKLLQQSGWKQRTALAVLVAGAGGTYGFYRRIANRPVPPTKETVDRALASGRLVDSEALVRRQLDATPDDTTAAARLAALQRHEAASDEDIPLLKGLLAYNLQRNLPDHAMALAQRIVRREPADRVARCLLATQALRDGKRKEAEEHMSFLPPASGASAISLWEIHTTTLIYGALGQREKQKEMLDVAARNWLPAIQLENRAGVSPAIALQVIELYQRSLLSADVKTPLLSQWGRIQEACRLCSNLPDVQVEDLERLGTFQENHLLLLTELARRGRVSAKDRQDMTVQIEKHLDAVWAKLLQMSPTAIKGHLGRATWQARAGKIEAALATLQDALVACCDKDVTPLLVARTRLSTRRDPAQGLSAAEQSLLEHPKSPPLQLLMVEAALAAKKPDKAMEACRQLAEGLPQVPWVGAFQAELCLRLNRPADAVAALDRFPDLVAQQPNLLKLKVRALSLAGRIPAGEALLERFAKEPKAAIFWSAGGFGYFEARNWEPAVRWALRALEKSPDEASAHLLAAEGLREQALTGWGTWDRAKARSAAEHYGRYLKARPGDLAVRANAAWLEMEGLADAEAAYRTAEPLRKLEPDPKLAPQVCYTLGIIYLGKRNAAAAVPMLERAVKAKATADNLFRLAQAYLLAGKLKTAGNTAAEAAAASKEPAERSEIEALIRRIEDEARKPALQ